MLRYVVIKWHLCAFKIVWTTVFFSEKEVISAIYLINERVISQLLHQMNMSKPSGLIQSLIFNCPTANGS